jgi:hypothetical protein
LGKRVMAFENQILAFEKGVLELEKEFWHWKR